MSSTVREREQEPPARRWRVVKISAFAVVAVAFVIAAALFISIIQFQIRIIEAKTQSKNFSLISLSQSVAMQKELDSSVAYVQGAQDFLASYEAFNNSFFGDLSQFVTLLCYGNDKDEARLRCASGIAGALQSGSGSQQYIYKVIALYGGFAADKMPSDIKPIADATIKLADRRDAFARANGEELTRVKTNCAVIERYFVLSGESSTDVSAQAVGLRGTSDEQGRSIIDSMSREYVVAARMRCYANFNTGAAAPVTLVAAKVDTKANPPDASAQFGTVAAPTPPTPNQNAANLRADLSNGLFFDLISYYRFYEKLLGATLTGLAVIAPIDITFILLVILCGGLGAMLRIVAESYDPKLFGKTHETPRAKIVYSFVLGIMCALIVYILARTVYAGLGESNYSSKSGNLSPFVTAFLAIISGLIYEEAFQQIIVAGKTLLAKTAGGSGSADTPRKQP
ncbi:MAG TPA: hypothetical protein VFW22_16770 [Pseudolabrys sp.]|nr:hypothetical protein [Pseudolabrys sp.]